MTTPRLSVLLPLTFAAVTAAGSAARAQTVAIFPDEYAAVADGPYDAANLPLANGTSRVQILYNAIDLAIPSGRQITKLGFREDPSGFGMDTGRIINVEIRMGWSTYTHTTLTSNYANNYTSPPVTVFGPANFTLPNLRDTTAPLTNGRFFIPLTTPFTYAPAAGQNLLVEYRVNGNSGGGTTFTYRLDRADYYSPVTYGPAGCQHSGGGTPLLTVQPCAPGYGYSAAISSGPGASPCVLAISPGSPLTSPYPLTGVFAGIDPACTGQLSPVGLVTLGGATQIGGTASFYFTVPNDPAFADFYISSQALFLDFFAPGGVLVSRGAQVLTGAIPRSSILFANGAPSTTTTGTVYINYCPVAFFEHN